MPEDDQDYWQMQVRVEKRVKKRAEFLLHLSIFVTANLMLWGLFLLLVNCGDSGDFRGFLIIPTVITLAWGLGLVIHGVDTYLQTGALDGMREREIRREIAMERLRRGIVDDDDDSISGKRKREPVMHLADDGELVPADEDDQAGDEPDNQQDQQNSRRARLPRSSDRK